MDEGFVMARADLAGVGLDGNTIRELCARGDLVRVRRGYYRRGESTNMSADAAHRLLIAATVSELVPGTLVSHTSAGLLWDLPIPERMLLRVTVLRHGSGGGNLGRWAHLRKAPVATADRDLLEGIPVTSLSRTVVDLCRVLTFPDAVAVADVALTRGLSKEDLLASLRRTRQPGNVRARAAIRFADARSESPGESRCRATMQLAALPAPALQYTIRTETGEFVARVDFAWPDLGVVGEYDGETKYGRLLRPGQHVADVLMREKAREERVRQCGYWVTRWVAKDLADVDAFRSGVLRAFALGPRTPPRVA